MEILNQFWTKAHIKLTCRYELDQSVQPILDRINVWRKIPSAKRTAQLNYTVRTNNLLFYFLIFSFQFFYQFSLHFLQILNPSIRFASNLKSNLQFSCIILGFEWFSTDIFADFFKNKEKFQILLCILHLFLEIPKNTINSIDSQEKPYRGMLKD